MASNQTLGVAVIKVDSGVLRSEPGATLDVGGYERDDVMGARVEDSGYASKAKLAMVDCTVMFDAGTRLNTFRNWSDVTVTFECDTGQVYVLPHAWLKNTPKLTASGGGKVSLQFAAPKAEETV